MQELNNGQNAAVGIVLGAIEVMIDQPTIYWKNAIQQDLPFTLNPKYIYRGLLASMSNTATLTMIQFFGAGFIKRAIVGDDLTRKLTSTEIMASALAGGALSGIACGPFELTMIQQQLFGGTIINTPARIIRDHGILGMTRGMLPSVLRESVFTFGYLGVTPVLEKKIVDNPTFASLNIPLPILRFGCSMCAGLFSVVLSQPADTVKTCMQGDVECKTYSRAMKSLMFIAKRDGGIQGWYRGFLWRYARIVMMFFIFNTLVHPVSHFMYPNAFIQNEDAEELEMLSE